MKKSAEKTNALRMLGQRGLDFKVHDYSDFGAVSGPDVAAALGEDPEKVFKTLVTVGKSGQHYVFVVPVCRELDLKKAAAAVKEKNVAMIPQKELLPLTGYIHGGCSPIGMKKLFPTVLHTSAGELGTLCVSGGRIGLQVELTPSALGQLTPYTLADIVTEEES